MEQNVKAAVRSFLQPNPKLDKYMNTIYLTASNLLTLSTQYIVTKSLLTNPEMFADKVHATEVSDAAFKKSKDVKGMKNFVINASVQNKKNKTIRDKKCVASLRYLGRRGRGRNGRI